MTARTEDNTDGLESKAGRGAEVRPYTTIIPEKPVTEAVYVSARTELINGIRTTFIQMRQIKNGRTRDFLHEYYPPYYHAETAIAHAVLNQVLPLAVAGQTVYYTLPGLDNRLPYPRDGVAFQPIESQLNPTYQLLNQNILKEVNHA